MRESACGVICEYDPFHNGHAYHLAALKEACAGARIVCAMSGHFTQRGHAALFSKWARAEMALRSGADIVFELPALFACRDAQRFALGGVALLSSLGVVTHLGFGSESGDISALLLEAARAEDAGQIRAGLLSGQSLARARDTLSGAPNDILALEYLRAIRTLRSGLQPICVKREGSGYHDEALSALPSATAVRAAILRGEDISGALPGPSLTLARKLLAAGAYQSPHGLDTALLALLRTMDARTLSEVADIGEGLENRLLRAAQRASGRDALLALLKCKRYTRARLSRVLTQAMLGITKGIAERNPQPAYARLLGFRKDAAPLLREMADSSAIPIVTRPAKFMADGGEAFALDIRAGDLWALGVQNAACRAGHADLTEKVVIVE